ncbi:MAG: phospholipase C/P1 nuclease family protein [Myxococcaceae bacterium]
MPANSCLRQWIAASQNYTFQNMSCDPDRWRVVGNPGYDVNEAPRHYLEIDWVIPLTNYPRDWAQAQVSLGSYAYSNGYVPWRIEEYYAQLVALFRATPPDSAAIRALLAHLSHYVTDSFSILHDTKNFDPGGLHARWESDMLNSAAYIDGITTLAAGYYGTAGRADPKNMTFDIVIVGNGLVAALVAADQAATANDGGAYDMPGFYSAVRDLTARRWGDALTLFASMVMSAWVDAGRPMLSGMPSGCSTAVPQGTVVLQGYPVPGGWPPVDAGATDAGADAGAGRDAGTDAGRADGGAGPDGGADSGIADAGSDAGSGPIQPLCTVLTCSGCCTWDGRCEPGATSLFCGAGGGLCAQCGGTRECEVGACVERQGGGCGCTLASPGLGAFALAFGALAWSRRRRRESAGPARSPTS